MEKTYFMGPENTCFANSLMNLLVELNDFECAIKVPERFRDSQLRTKKSTINLVLMTRAVRDFTSNKYSAILYANITPDIEKALSKQYNDGKQDLKSIIQIAQEEITAGNIIPHKGFIPQNPPEILFLEEDGNLHAVIYRKDKKYIDEGLVLSKEQMVRLSYDLRPAAVLHIKPNF